jgi:hypothetical protein
MIRNTCIAILLALAVGQAHAIEPRVRGPFEPGFRTEPSDLASNSFNGDGKDPYVAFDQVLTGWNGAWTRLLFDPAKVNLGQHSFVRITSLQDGEVQHLRSWSMQEWSFGSAFFNGPSVRIELVVHPEDQDVRFGLAWHEVGEFEDGVPPTFGERSICGADDRVDSSEDRVARYNMGGCSHWFVATGATLTAGHCTDFDPDDDGPMLPDGVIDFSGVVMINPPASSCSGATVASPVADQYPLIPSTARFRFDGEGQGLGKDWCVYNLGRNSENNDLAHDTRGFYRMTDDVPVSDQTIRITGFGLDNTPAGCTGNRNSDNFTNQTNTDPYGGYGTSGANHWHEYSTDTEGGNSGSPIIWNNNGFTIGVHTNGGCDNSGTAFTVTALQNALRNNVATNAVFADHSGRSFAGLGLGTAVDPYSNLQFAVAGVSNGGVIALVEGSYTAAAGGNAIASIGGDGKAMTLRTLTGPVTIGN